MRRVLQTLGRRWLVMFGLAALLTVIFAALAAPWLTSHSPTKLRVQDRLQSPSAIHWFGTDHLGRDVYARVLYGARVSLRVGAGVALASAVAGTTAGLAAGYFRHVDNILMRIMDGMMAFPGLLLALAIMAAVGPSELNIMAALTVVYIPRVTRVVRSSVLAVRGLEYVQAVEALGGSDTRILLRHILPNCLPPLLVQISFTFAYAVLAEAALSFLGVGTPPDQPTWGNILSEGREFMLKAPWMTLFPGSAISVTVLGINLLGDALRDALDPRLRGRDL